MGRDHDGRVPHYCEESGGARAECQEEKGRECGAMVSGVNRDGSFVSWQGRRYGMAGLRTVPSFSGRGGVTGWLD